jgi:hypothetical protein
VLSETIYARSISFVRGVESGYSLLAAGVQTDLCRQVLTGSIGSGCRSIGLGL